LQLGLTQDALAERIGPDDSAMIVSHYETARRTPSAAALKRLADALECSADWLLGRVSEPQERETARKAPEPASEDDRASERRETPGLTWDQAASIAEANGERRFTWQGTLYVLRRDGWEALP
jgi:transcriptional regulator with XRE-family HTH domain